MSVLNLTGRKTLTYSGEVNSLDDVKKALLATYSDFMINKSEISYLWDYYLGKQDILKRTKLIRKDILKNTVVNHAHQIVSFFSTYTFGEGTQYVKRGTSIYDLNNNDDSVDIAKINDGLSYKDKRADDSELSKWFLATGVAYRSVFPMENFDIYELPIDIGVLDPRNTSIIYSNGLNKKPLVAFTVNSSVGADQITRYKYFIYTENYFWELEGVVKDFQLSLDSNVIRESELSLGGLFPIIEYNANAEKQGIFEPVIPILNLINEVTTNRGEAVEQFIQSYWKFINADISEDDYLKFIQSGAISISAGRDDKFPSDVDLIKQELDQTGVQALVDDLSLRAFQITGVPDRRNSTGGSTGAANMVSNGWYDTDSKVDALEGVFIKSEKKFLRLLLNISRRLSNEFKFENTQLPDIDIKFSRNKTDNILVKTQALQSLLTSGIHPRVAISVCGLFSDPEAVYEQSKLSIEQNKVKGVVPTDNKNPNSSAMT